jgi:hypothetical protein
VLKARRQRRDPQRRRVYAWEQETVGHLDHEPLLGETADRKITQNGARKAALGYLTHLWTTYAKRFAPYYCGVPYLRVGFATARGKSRPRRRAGYGAYAVPLRHEIYCRLGSLRRTTFVHEVCHLFPGKKVTAPPSARCSSGCGSRSSDRPGESSVPCRVPAGHGRSRDTWHISGSGVGAAAP